MNGKYCAFLGSSGAFSDEVGWTIIFLLIAHKYGNIQPAIGSSVLFNYYLKLYSLTLNQHKIGNMEWSLWSPSNPTRLVRRCQLKFLLDPEEKVPDRLSPSAIVWEGGSWVSKFLLELDSFRFCSGSLGTTIPPTSIAWIDQHSFRPSVFLFDRH